MRRFCTLGLCHPAVGSSGTNVLNFYQFRRLLSMRRTCSSIFTHETSNLYHFRCNKLFFSSLKASETDDYLKNIHEKYEKEKESKKQKWDKWRKYSLLCVPVSVAVLVGWSGHVYGEPRVDSVTGVVFEDEFTGQWFENVRRAVKSIREDVRTQYAEPSRKKLLPDPMPKPYIQPKYTVLIELRDLLVHPEWNFETGWRFKKRPGVDFLLESIAMPHQFEIVIFTSEPAMMAAPVVESLNSKGTIMYSLFRDSTHYKDNVYMKDISRINRDLSKVIVIDTDRAKVKPNPENSLVLPKWDGNMADRNLYDLAMFLRAVEKTHCNDVRVFLKAYSNEPDPLETFRQRQIILEQQQQEKQQKNKNKVKSKSLFGKL